jgi:hypothetical protein
MTQQLPLFDLPTAQEAPGRALKARTSNDATPVPKAAQAPAQPRQEAPGGLDRQAERRAEHARWLALQRYQFALLCSERPAPPLSAMEIVALARVGVTYIGAHSASGEPEHVVEGLFSSGLGRTILTKTRDGIAALCEALDLPDDLCAAGLRRHGHTIFDIPDDPTRVSISYHRPTLELNIAAAREGLAARRRIEAEGRAKKEVR